MKFSSRLPERLIITERPSIDEYFYSIVHELFDHKQYVLMKLNG